MQFRTTSSAAQAGSAIAGPCGGRRTQWSQGQLRRAQRGGRPAKTCACGVSPHGD